MESMASLGWEQSGGWQESARLMYQHRLIDDTRVTSDLQRVPLHLLPVLTSSAINRGNTGLLNRSASRVRLTKPLRSCRPPLRGFRSEVCSRGTHLQLLALVTRTHLAAVVR